MFESRSQVIGSIIKVDRLRTLQIPTYVRPDVDSFLPISVKALPKVIPIVGEHCLLFFLLFNSRDVKFLIVEHCCCNRQ